jgi:serine/threonine protein phosphatase 1
MRPGDTLAIVGDIHGQARRLHAALDQLRPSGMHIVFVGDYVDRGPDSRMVLDELATAKQDLGDQLTLLRGNHDQVLLDFIDHGNPRELIAHGGAATVRSYLRDGRGGFDEFRETFPDLHLNLLRATVDCYETPELLVTHAGFNPADIGSRRPSDVRGNGFPAMFDYGGPWPRPLTVCGHFVQRGGTPYMSDRLVCVDTGCGSVADGPLSVLYWPSITVESY